MRGLYAIVDVTSIDRARLDVVAVAEAMLEARPACLQLRAKDEPPRRALELLRALRTLTRRAGVPLFANDRPDLAMLSLCDGVHVGQEDLSALDVRAVSSSASRSLLVGLSTHNRAQLLDALEAPIDYVAIGPVFGTGSKKDPDPSVGVEGLRALAALVREKRASLPIVAIGGLHRARIAELRGVVDMFAVIGALLPSEPMPERAALDLVRQRTGELVDAASSEGTP